jgi:hypothetical protein
MNQAPVSSKHVETQDRAKSVPVGSTDGHRRLLGERARVRPRRHAGRGERSCPTALVAAQMSSDDCPLIRCAGGSQEGLAREVGRGRRLGAGGVHREQHPRQGKHQRRRAPNTRNTSGSHLVSSCLLRRSLGCDLEAVDVAPDYTTLKKDFCTLLFATRQRMELPCLIR